MRFLTDPALAPGAHGAFFLPGVSDDTTSPLEDCARRLDQAIAMTVANEMPQIGTRDWNDGMNRGGAAVEAPESGLAYC